MQSYFIAFGREHSTPLDLRSDLASPHSWFRRRDVRYAIHSPCERSTEPLSSWEDRRRLVGIYSERKRVPHVWVSACGRRNYNGTTRMRHFKPTSSTGLILLALPFVCCCQTQPLSPTNPFYAPSPLPYHAPPFDRIKDSDYRPAIEAGIAEKMRRSGPSQTTRRRPTSPIPSFRYSSPVSFSIAPSRHFIASYRPCPTLRSEKWKKSFLPN